MKDVLDLARYPIDRLESVGPQFHRALPRRTARDRNVQF